MNRDLQELAKLFGKLGCIAFGGPAAHIAMMRDEVVRRRKWMDDQHFLDLVGATNLIPGPNSTEMAIHIGKERAGWKGLVVAGSLFIVPAVLITLLFAWLYKEYGELPEVQSFIYGIKPAIIAIILGAVFPLAKTSVKTTFLGILGLASLILCLLQVNDILVMFGSGLIGLIFGWRNKNGRLHSIFPLLVVSLNMKLFLTFLKIGAILYGSGYVLFAFLDEELVKTGIISSQQLVDAIAVGQITPGPVFSSVTFIGYQINGWTGAMVSTIAIFLPAFLFVALLNPLVKKMRSSTTFGAFLDAVNVASVAVIAAVCYEMGKVSVYDWKTAFIGIIAMMLVFGYKKLNSAWIIVGASLTGYLLSLI